MAGNEASWAIELPNQFEPFGNILQREIDAQGNQNQYFYNQQLREQQKQEQDKWKKLALIQDYTDLSKHQTGSDVANAIGNKKMAEIVQKYSQLSSSMSPEQLLYELNKEVSGTVSAMDGIKNELQIGEESIKQLKQNYPYLNAEQMAKDFRQDVLDRRLKNDSEFTPQLSIGQSAINFSDPEILAKYVTGNKSLLKAINEDKGDEVTALMGKQGDYTKYEGKIKPYQKLGYDPTKVNSEGFYVGKDIPSFKIKSSTLPAETMTDSGGNPLEIIDDDVYQRYVQDGGINLELIAATKQAFPNYSELSPQQKNYAKRNTLYKIISANDQSRMNPTANVRPPVTNIRNYSGQTSSETQIRDIFKEVKRVTSDRDRVARNAFAPLNELSATAQKVLIKYANDLTNEGLTQADIYVQQKPDGRIYIARASDNKVIAPIDFEDVNIGVQPGVKEKREVIKQGGNQQESGYSNISKIKDPKGNVIEAGVKNGKWYNIKTGKPL